VRFVVRPGVASAVETSDATIFSDRELKGQRRAVSDLSLCLWDRVGLGEIDFEVSLSFFSLPLVR
jgi:hypothetical protein